MIRKILIFFLILGIITVILNLPVTTKQGIDGIVRTFKIPLYIKIIEFLDRDYWYRILAEEITRGSVTDKEKVMAIFNWVIDNIHKPPKGFVIFDDHVLNIIMRRYGARDQMADVFTTLCVYSGVPAFWRFESLRKGERFHYIEVSYVLLDNKWRVFDVSRNTFFLNKDGEIASLEDILSDISIVQNKEVPYEDYFKNLKPINKNFISKEQKQMPLFRIIYEIQRIFKT